MEDRYGLSNQMYRAITGLLDERMEKIIVTRQDYERLVQEQTRLDLRMERLEGLLERLIEVQSHAGQQTSQVVVAQNTTEEILKQMIDWLEQNEQGQIQFNETMTALRDRVLEARYRERAATYFGPVLRRARAFAPIDLEAELESRLTAFDYLDLLKADLLIRGRPRRVQEEPEVWLAVEISAAVNREVVERALWRAGHLRAAGLMALPVALGDRATEEATEMAKRQGVVLVLDGNIDFWEEALALAKSKRVKSKQIES